jgi:hypothetical protein
MSFLFHAVDLSAKTLGFLSFDSTPRELSQIDSDKGIIGYPLKVTEDRGDAGVFIGAGYIDRNSQVDTRLQSARIIVWGRRNEWKPEHTRDTISGPIITWIDREDERKIILWVKDSGRETLAAVPISQITGDYIREYDVKTYSDFKYFILLSQDGNMKYENCYLALELGWDPPNY